MRWYSACYFLAYAILVASCSSNAMPNLAACANHDAGFCPQGTYCLVVGIRSGCVTYDGGPKPEAGGGVDSRSGDEDTGELRIVDGGVERPGDARTDPPAVEAGASAPPDARVSPGPDSGPACTNACAAGDKRCSGGGVESCSANLATGCTDWSNPVACTSPQVCMGSGVNVFCGTPPPMCTNACVAGRQRCSGGGVEICGTNAGTGCTEWGAPSPCTMAPQLCRENGNSASCGCAPGGCSVGAQRCAGGSDFQTCQSDGVCTAWGPATSCGSGMACTGAGLCSPTCTNACALGARRCGGGGVQDCVQQGACTAWGSGTSCGPGMSCTGPGNCSPTCANECTPGSQRCSGRSASQACVQMGLCTVWGAETSCGGGFCDMQSGRCMLPRSFGDSCSSADQCVSNFCAPNHQCCAAAETNNDRCFTSGTICQRMTGACGFPDGNACTLASECASRNCKQRGFCAGRSGGIVECTNDDGVCADSAAGCKFSGKCEPRI
jgi:hypothetical protein